MAVHESQQAKEPTCGVKVPHLEIPLANECFIMCKAEQERKAEV